MSLPPDHPPHPADGASPQPPARSDPGWPAPSLRAILAALVPGMLGRLSTDPTVPAVTVLRRVFVGFVGALVVIGAILLVVIDPAAPPEADARIWVLLAMGAISTIAGTNAARRRRVVCAEPAKLARQVGAATFFGVATANSAALTGFVGAFLADALWPYLVGLLPTAVGLVRAAPTRRRIRELDEHLELVGCHLSASQVLYALPDDPSHPVAPGPDPATPGTPGSIDDPGDPGDPDEPTR